MKHSQRLNHSDGYQMQINEYLVCIQVKTSNGNCSNIVRKTSFRTLAKVQGPLQGDLKSGRDWDRRPELHGQGQSGTKEPVWVSESGTLLRGGLAKSV